MSVRVEIESDSHCNACGAEGDVLAVRQQRVPLPQNPIITRTFCVPCFRETVKQGEAAIAEFTAKHDRFPEARR